MQVSVGSMAYYALISMIAILWIPSLTSVGDFNLNIIFIGLFTLILLLRKPIKTNIKLTFDDNVIFLLVLSIAFLFIYSLISAGWAEEPLRVFRPGYAQFAGLIIILFFKAFVTQQKVIDKTVNIFLMGAIFSALLAVAAYYIPAVRGILISTNDRTAAFFKQSNQLGIVLAMTIPMVAVLMLTKNNILKGTLSVLFVYLGIILSGSKTNLVIGSLAIIVLVFFLFIYRKTFIKAPYLIFIAILVLYVVAIGGFELLGYLNPRAQRILLSFVEEGSAPSISIRQYVWADSIDQGLLHPLTGVGAGQSAFNDQFTHSHNVFIDYFRTLGFPGLFFISVQILCCVLLALRTFIDCVRLTQINLVVRLKMTALSIAIFCYIASNQLSDSFGPSTILLFWVCVGQLIAYRKMAITTLRMAQKQASN